MKEITEGLGGSSSRDAIVGKVSGTGRRVLILRRTKGAMKPTWRLAKISQINFRDDLVTVEEIKRLPISSIQAVAWPSAEERGKLYPIPNED